MKLWEILIVVTIVIGCAWFSASTFFPSDQTYNGYKCEQWVLRGGYKSMHWDCERKVNVENKSAPQISPWR